LAHVSTETQFLGKTVKIPLLISSMTGGSAKGELINLRLAEAANSCGIAMGVGSQRADIENWTVGKRSSIRDVLFHSTPTWVPYNLIMALRSMNA